ncbi:MAG: hypothetical protein GF334_07005 [Candidatus Altiarchaeales archaeon]|nr:hypothetical protein [Candidatus Altiarchaeales archaeon]
MKVFVNMDPLYEDVVCVHTTEEGECEKCRKIMAEGRTSYQLAGDWYEVVEDEKT